MRISCLAWGIKDGLINNGGKEKQTPTRLFWDSLWQEHHYASETLDYYLSMMVGNGSNNAPELRTDWKEREELLRSKAQFGGFYISSDAADALRKFFSALAKIDYEDVMEPPEVYFSASKTCMEDLQNAAVADLGIRWERRSPTTNQSQSRRPEE